MIQPERGRPLTPVTLHSSDEMVAQKLSEREVLQARLEAAADYHDDFLERDSHFTRYRFGSYEPTLSDSGIVIAEEIVPPAELLTSLRDRIYGQSTRAMNSHMYANSLPWLLRENIGRAISNLGFGARAYQTDVHGSRLIAVTYPSVPDFNKRLHGRNSHALILQPASLEQPPNAEQRSRALAAGIILSSNALDMITQVSMIGLLAPSVTQELQRAAQHVIDNPDQPIPDKQNSTQQDAFKQIERRLSGLSTLHISRKLIDACGGIFEPGPPPSTVLDLGYELAQIVSLSGDKRPDHGLQLALETIAHIRRLTTAA